MSPGPVGAGSLDLEVHVRPGARRTEVGGTHDGVLVVRVAAPAVEGKANEAVLAAVASALGVRPRDVELVRGGRSRRKRLRVDGDPARLSERVAELAGAARPGP